MLTKTLKQWIGYHSLYSTYILGCSTLSWDRHKNQFVLPPKQAIWTLMGMSFSGWGVLLLMSVYTISLRLSGEDKQLIRSTNIILFYITGLMLLSVFVLAQLFSHRSLQYRHQIKYLFNQLFFVSDYFQAHLDSRGGTTNRKQQLAVQKFDGISKLLILVSMLMPILISVGLILDFTPFYVFAKDVLEFEITLEFRKIPVFMMAWWGSSVAAGAVHKLIEIVILYSSLGIICFELIAPANIYHREWCGRGWSYLLHNHKLGVYTDQEAIQLYRICQLIDTFVNEVLASIKISFHYIVLMVVFLCFSYGLTSAREAVFNSHFVAPTLSVVGLFMTFGSVYLVSFTAGNFATVSGTFVVSCQKLFLRKSYFYKFSRSCPKYLTIKAAYPFFKVDRKTLPQFFSQGIDFLITIFAIDSV